MKNLSIIKRLKTSKAAKEYYKKHPFFFGSGISKKTGEPCVRMSIRDNSTIEFESWEDVQDVVKSLVGFYSDMCDSAGIKTKTGISLSSPVIGSEFNASEEKYNIVIYPPTYGTIKLHGRDGVEDFIRQIREECNAIEDYCKERKNEIKGKCRR